MVNSNVLLHLGKNKMWVAKVCQNPRNPVFISVVEPEQSLLCKMTPLAELVAQHIIDGQKTEKLIRSMGQICLYTNTHKRIMHNMLLKHYWEQTRVKL